MIYVTEVLYVCLLLNPRAFCTLQQRDRSAGEHMAGGAQRRGGREGDDAVVDPAVRRRRHLRRSLRAGPTRHQNNRRRSDKNHSVEVSDTLRHRLMS